MKVMALRDYTLNCFIGGSSADWSRVLAFRDDGAAIEEARRLLVDEASFTAARMPSIVVGRGYRAGRIQWLGEWNWNDGAHWSGPE
jgi:hypothetical protein